jgi:hypothetical protein
MIGYLPIVFHSFIVVLLVPYDEETMETLLAWSGQRSSAPAPEAADQRWKRRCSTAWIEIETRMTAP